MQYIQFIGRAEELRLLTTLRSPFFAVVKGRRRIGKTTLICKAFPKAPYLFIWPNKTVEWLTNEICKELQLPQFSRLIDILAYLLDRNETVLIDEFQNFLSVDASFFGELQKLIDERKHKRKPIRIIASGSSYSLINKVFNDAGSPLYGRRTHDMTLEELPPEEIFTSLGLSIERFIETWAVFGGVPYYYEIIEPPFTFNHAMKNSLLIDEGKAVLSVEFGSDSKVYNTVLTAIAEGKKTLGEISSLFSNKRSSTIKYIDILRRQFHLVRRTTPILSSPKKSKEGIYEINDNFLSFWFNFIDNKKDLIEQDRFEELQSYFETNFPGYVGRKFEELVRYLVRKKILLHNMDFSKVGKQWGRSADNTYEIDLLALNQDIILLGECKWKKNINALSIIKELSEKSKNIVGTKNVQYAVFAKSFAKQVTSFEGAKVHCIDIHAIGRAMHDR